MNEGSYFLESERTWFWSLWLICLFSVFWLFIFQVIIIIFECLLDVTQVLLIIHWCCVHRTQFFSCESSRTNPSSGGWHQTNRSIAVFLLEETVIFTLLTWRLNDWQWNHNRLNHPDGCWLTGRPQTDCVQEQDGLMLWSIKTHHHLSVSSCECSGSHTDQV